MAVFSVRWGSLKEGVIDFILFHLFHLMNISFEFCCLHFFQGAPTLFLPTVPLEPPYILFLKKNGGNLWEEEWSGHISL